MESGSIGTNGQAKMSKADQAPSLDLSLDISSDSLVLKLENPGVVPTSQTSQMANECVTDRVVRFFCPFDASAHEAHHQHHFTTGNKNNGSDEQVRSQFDENADLRSYHHDCADGWLKPVETICIPKDWESSPERPEVGLVKIQNRQGALDENMRKGEYINQLRKQWHSSSPHVPLRNSTSFRQDTTRKPSSLTLANTTSVYYDSDPEIPATTPKYKRNRPYALSLNLNGMEDSDMSDSECPQVPRHSSEKLKSFFADSPKSVAEGPDFENEDEVKELIRVSLLIYYNALCILPV